MFVCKNCGSIFGTLQVGNGKSVCPDCGSTNWGEATQCKLCKDYFIPCPSYREYCDDCLLNAEDQLRHAVAKYVDPDYVDMLCDEYNDLDFIINGDQQ